MKAEQVIEAGRRFLEANDEAAVLGGRPTDPDVARVSGLPLFDAAKALAAAVRSRDAREDFREALASWDSERGQL